MRGRCDSVYVGVRCRLLKGHRQRRHRYWTDDGKGAVEWVDCG